MRSRLLPVWMYATGFNLVCTFIMLKPLRPEEISAQCKRELQWADGLPLFTIFLLMNTATSKSKSESIESLT